MTVVRAPFAGWAILTARPLRRRVDDQGVIHLPTPHDPVEADDGVVLLDLAPTESWGCWEIVEGQPGGIKRYVLVPDSNEVIAYSALVDVDPDSFEPTADPSPAWIAMLTEVAGRVAALEFQSGGGPAPVPVPFVQLEPSSVWAFAHGLGYRPGGIRVVDTDGSTHVPEVAYPTASTITLTFGYAVAGTAYLS